MTRYTFPFLQKYKKRLENQDAFCNKKIKQLIFMPLTTKIIFY